VLAYVPGLRDFGIDTLKSEAPVNTCLRFAWSRDLEGR
jgi:hypothetical protein